MADPDATEHDRKTSHDHNTRKRKRVSYVELLDPEASDLSDEEEEEYGQKPLKRVKISKSKSRAAVKKIDKKPKKPFPFLLLPRELRDMIYVSPSLIHIISGTSKLQSIFPINT